MTINRVIVNVDGKTMKLKDTFIEKILTLKIEKSTSTLMRLLE